MKKNWEKEEVFFEGNFSLDVRIQSWMKMKSEGKSENETRRLAH